MTKISIVIPNWNGQEKLRKHLPGVLKAAKHSKVEEIIVVDDKSSDESVRVLKIEFPEVKVIEKDQNSGFSSTVNLGVKSSQGELVVLLNSDASPKEDFLDFILPHFKDKNVFSVGGSVGGGWSGAEFKDGFFWHNMVEEKLQEAHSTLWVSGGSGVFRRSIWDELGGLDTLFDPFYEEDLDLGYRATKRGYINLLEPKSKVEHYKEIGVIKEHFSTKKVARIAQRNQLIFIWKNITNREYINGHIKALFAMLIKHPTYILVFLSAFYKLPQILEKREIEKRYSKLTDQEVLSMFKPS